MGQETNPNDIAVLQLESLADFNNPNMAAIALPEYEESFTGRPCNFTGWGFNIAGERKWGMGLRGLVEVVQVSNWPAD